MTTLNIILILITVLTFTWACVISVYAIEQIKKANRKVKYYQHPKTQMEIALHVIKHNWFKKGGEVFR